MLYSSKIEERVDKDGTKHILILDEMEANPCARCGGESVPNVCAGDGRYHYHGRVHTLEGGLDALCHNCAAFAQQDWVARRSTLHGGLPNAVTTI